MMRFLAGNRKPSGAVPRGYSDRRAPEATICRNRVACERGYTLSTPQPSTATVPPPGYPQCPVVRCGIDAMGTSGNNSDTSGCKLSGKHGTDTSTIFTGGPCPDHGHRRTFQPVEITMAIQEHWRIVKVAKTLRILGTMQRKQGKTMAGQLLQFVSCPLSGSCKANGVGEHLTQARPYARKSMG
jgi:hypothetical protein